MSSGASDAVSSIGSSLAPVSEVVVNPAVSGALSGAANAGSGIISAGSNALGSALAGSKTKTPAAPTPAAGTQNGDGSTNLSEVVTTAPSSTSSTPSLLNLSPALLSAMGGNDFTSSASRVAGLNSASANFANSPNEPTDVSEVVATAPSLASPAIQTAAAPPGQVPGLMSNESGMQDLNYGLKPPVQQTDEQKKQTLLQKLGLEPKDLLGLGLLGLGYASSQGKPGIETNQNYQDLAASADQNKQLISQLSQSADAGRMGNIGGSAMNQIRQTVRNAQAAIRQRYSSMGMSGSTAETSDLNAAVQQGLDAQFKFGQDIATSGLQAVAQLSNVNANIYSTLLKAQTAQDTDLGNALANFVGKASGALHTPNIAPATTATAQAA